MTFETILADLKNKIYKPIYLLFGEESYFIDEISNYISKNVLNESEKSFNQTVLYGKDSTVKDIIELCRRFPMMANYQVVIIKEAQDLKNFKDLDVYVEKPLSSTILVLNFKYTKKIDKRIRLYNLVKKQGVIFESKKLYESGIYKWINSYLKAQGLTIHPEASRLLYESIGGDLSRIINNLEKLKIGIQQGQSQIELNDVATNIGVHRDFNIFELQKALGSKDSTKAYKIITYFGNDPKNNPLVRNLTLLFEYFLKVLKYHTLSDKSKNNVASEIGISPFFVDEYKIAANNYPPGKVISIISYLREYDLKSKGVDANAIPEGDLMKELVYKILH